MAICILSGLSLVAALVNLGLQVYLQADARHLWYECVPLPRLLQVSPSECAAGCGAIVLLGFAGAAFVVSLVAVL